MRCAELALQHAAGPVQGEGKAGWVRLGWFLPSVLVSWRGRGMHVMQTVPQRCLLNVACPDHPERRRAHRAGAPIPGTPQRGRPANPEEHPGHRGAPQQVRVWVISRCSLQGVLGLARATLPPIVATSRMRRCVSAPSVAGLTGYRRSPAPTHHPQRVPLRYRVCQLAHALQHCWADWCSPAPTHHPQRAPLRHRVCELAHALRHCWADWCSPAPANPVQRVPLRHRVCQLAHALRYHGGHLPARKPGVAEEGHQLGQVQRHRRYSCSSCCVPYPSAMRVRWQLEWLKKATNWAKRHCRWVSANSCAVFPARGAGSWNSVYMPGVPVIHRGNVGRSSAFSPTIYWRSSCWFDCLQAWA